MTLIGPGYCLIWLWRYWIYSHSRKRYAKVQYSGGDDEVTVHQLSPGPRPRLPECLCVSTVRGHHRGVEHDPILVRESVLETDTFFGTTE